MQVREEFVWSSAAHPRAYDLSPDHEASNIETPRRLDVFLNQGVLLGSPECLDRALRGTVCFADDDTDSLRAFQQLDHEWNSADHLDQVFRIP